MTTDYFEVAKDIVTSDSDRILFDHMKKRIHDLETVIIQIQELIGPKTAEQSWQLHIIHDLCDDAMKKR